MTMVASHSPQDKQVAASKALVQTRIEQAVKDRAAAVLDGFGLTVSDVVRILLTRIANEGTIPIELTVNREEYDAWFRARVKEALDDHRPDDPHEDVEARFAAKRAWIEGKNLE